MMTGKRLEGKVALITGAAQGIGKAIAIAFAKEGAQVIVSDVNGSEGNAVAHEIGGKSFYLHLDVKQENEWKSAMHLIAKRFGKLNILVNNAGITGFQEGFGPQDPEHASLTSWHQVHAVNSDGVFQFVRSAENVMRAQKLVIEVLSRSSRGIPQKD